MCRWCMNRFTVTFMATVCLSLFSSIVWAETMGWPRHFNTSIGKVVVYQPQPSSLNGDDLSARSAISVTPNGKMIPVYGTTWFHARIQTDRDARTVSPYDITVTDVRFPRATAAQSKTLSEGIRAAFPKLDLTMSLDRLMASLEAADDPDASSALRMDPPKIIYVNYPAVLVILDGDPILQPVADSSLMQVVNTPFFIVQDASSSKYYLYGDGYWYSTRDILAGPWTSGVQPPAQVVDLLKKNQGKGLQQPEAGSAPPQVIVSTVPTELISSNGDPAYSPTVGAQLFYMSNTDQNVFLDTSTSTYYVLLSGRWYTSQSLNGPWDYIAADQLPAAFSSIPSDSPRARVRASVAGTPEAKDALADAQIPQTSVIKRNAPGPKVTYDGDPSFEQIAGTSVWYAVNTGSQVLRIRGTYYCCYQGVWYSCRNATGPWIVATSIPDDVQVIPPSNPCYNTKYVYIYRYTPDVVYVGYSPGYGGCYSYGPTVVWGTGWYYPGWHHRLYFPRPITFGCGASFDLWTGDWAFGIGFGPGWFDWGFGWGAFWEPWWGPYGFHYFYDDFHHRRFSRFDGRFFGRDHNIFNRPENRFRNFGRSQPRSLRPFTSGRQPNNIFSGRNGDVFRRTWEGWQQRGTNRWSNPQSQPYVPRVTPRYTSPRTASPSQRSSGFYRPMPTAPWHPLEPDFQARTRGDTRANQYGNINSTPSPRGGNYAPGSGSGRSAGPRSGGGQGRSAGPGRGGGQGRSGGGRR